MSLLTCDSTDRLADRNLLLRTLPAAALRAIAPALEVVPLARDSRLPGAGEPITWIYFPTGAVISQVIAPDFAGGEIATIGRRGVLGLSAAIGSDGQIFSSATIVPGLSLRLDGKTFRRALASHPEMRQVFARYTTALLYQVGQLSACHARCEVRPRVASWLLRAADEAGSTRLGVTHDVIALCLAIRRASVSKVMEELVAGGLIKQGRGMVEMMDPRGVRRVACDCYRQIRARYRQVATELRVLGAARWRSNSKDDRRGI